MIISPPFLPRRAAATSEPADPEAFADPDDDLHDAAYVASAMVGGDPGAGAYPVSQDMNWHGGIHLTAPTDSDGTPHQVRAIADGTVVVRRNPTPKSATADHVLNYGGGWTDDGCLVLRHETEIGANENGTPTSVTFFSIYMHLRAIPDDITLHGAVYRKAKVGTAGSVYGTENTIHFEIACDQENVIRLVGRSNPYLSVDRDGRTDAVFGTMWFFLPAGTPFFRDKPASTTRPPAAYTSREALWVGMRFELGTCVMETRHLDGQMLGPPVREEEYEYKLVETARQIYPQRPSAGYELLRFGRVIGPEPLKPIGASHWRRVAYDGGMGWVDFNDGSVKRFSDADFPTCDREWTLVDGSTSAFA